MIPLSFAQQRLWFLDQLSQLGASHNAPVVLRLRGHVDAAALQAALNDVIGRHESLRTVFPVVDGQPYQRILDPAQASLHMDVRHCEPAAMRPVLDAAALGGFDLASEPPVRAALFVLGRDDHAFMLVLHHIVSDGWSVGPLIRDLAAAYQARCAGRAPAWDPLPVQYADYTLWQRDLLGDEDDPDSLIARQLRYWSENLAGLPDEVPLPCDRPRPTVRTYDGDVVPFSLPATLHRELLTLARDTRATLFMVLQAALATLLTRLGAGTDIAVGSTIAGRTDEALDDLVGFFVNNIVLRTDTAGNPTFRELLARVRETDLAAYANQDLPFERLVEVLNPARAMSRHPLFQVSMNLQSNEKATLELHGLDEVSFQAVSSFKAKFDLTAAFAENYDGGRRPAGIDANLEYASELFDRATAQLMAERLQRLLEAIVADPDARIGDVDLLSPRERQQVRHDWNATAVDVPPVTLPALFAEQVARTPDATAVVFEGRRLTYGELDARANRLARMLIARGARPGRVVAVAVPRSPELIVALYAVHKTGAAYLPVDPDYPERRIAFMLADADPALLLTTVATAELSTVPRVLLEPGLERELAAFSGAPVTDADRTAPLTPADPAYVIYTSGSTGRPKGVVVSHAAIANRLLWMQAEYRLTTADRVLQKTPASFDVSVWEFFWPLLVGAALVVAPPGAHHDPGHLAELIDREQVTTVHFVPSMLEVFLAVPGASDCRSLRLVFVSGEPLARELAARFSAVLDVPLHNLYGPAEAAVDVTYWQVPPAVEGPVPIGRPVWNTQAFVLDNRLRPVPPGAEGELYLGGAQLARGYVNRAALTAERFVASPFAAGQRLYRTGDLARWRPDGVLEFRGRVDRQMKVCGRRIELPAPSVEVATSGRTPRSEREEILCGLFAEVLGVERVTIDDSFFDLGGHSMLAIRLAGRIRTQLALDVPIRALFDNPTVAELAAFDERTASRVGAELAADAVLDSAITAEGCLPVDERSYADPARVLLTGATGFLGAFLLRELLDRTRAEVWCLVRADGDEEARARVRRSLTTYGLWDPAFADRIVAVRGDLEKPLLGLDPVRFEALAEHTDAIYHNGARVNHLEPYQRLRAANVLGTQEVLRLAATRRLKPVHYVSSVSATVATGPNPTVLLEDRRIPARSVVPVGYVASKWVAEQLMWAAAERGIPVAVFRPGRISGHSGTGASGVEDSFWNFIRAVTVLGAAPDHSAGAPADIGLVPVDYVVRALVQLAGKAASNGKAHNLINCSPVPPATVFAHLRAFGYELESLSGDAWQRRLADAAERSDSLGPAVLLSGGFLSSGPGIRWDHANTQAGLVGSAIPGPNLTGEVIARYLEYFVESGFFPAPAAHGSEEITSPERGDRVPSRAA